MKKIEQQLNKMLQFANKKELNTSQKAEINKIGFLYSVGRMSALEVALRFWYLICNNVDGIYEKSFQDFMEATCRWT